MATTPHVSKYVWIKCDEEGDMEEMLKRLAHENKTIKEPKVCFSSAKLTGNKEVIKEIASDLEKLFPGKSKLKCYPPFESSDYDPLTITVTLTLYFSLDDSALSKEELKCTDDDFRKIAYKISQRDEFEVKPAVSLVVKEKPRELYGQVRSFSGKPYTCPERVVDVYIRNSRSTSIPVGTVVTNTLENYWSQCPFFFDNVNIDNPPKPEAMTVRSRL